MSRTPGEPDKAFLASLAPAILEDAPDAILVTDPEGRIVLVNARFEELTGYDRNEVLGHDVELLVPEARRHDHLGKRRAWTANPEPRPMGRGLDISLRRKDGTDVPADVSLSPIATARGTWSAAAIRDVSEERRARDEARRAATGMARANEELQQFAYVASHDLREPLRKIQSFGERLETRYGDLLEERGRDYLMRMRNAAARMSTFIQDLLSFSRVATHGRDFQPVDLGGIASAVVSDLGETIRETGARVDVGDLPRIDADPTQMRQLLQNLVENSLKFRRDDVAPEIRITGRTIPAPEREAGEWVEIVVEDNGIGFDPKDAGRILRPFERLHGRSEYEGSGMGLAVANRIVRRHDGELVPSGEPGSGATFRIRLPAHAHEDGATDESTTPQPDMQDGEGTCTHSDR